MKKELKETHIFFDEQNPLVYITTYNTDLKKRLLKYTKLYPDVCRQTDDDEFGGLSFEIPKGRFGFKLTAPYSEERRKAASERAMEKGLKGRVI